MRTVIVGVIKVASLCFLVGGSLAEELSQDYLERWTPGGDTNALDLPYRHRVAPFERENDDDWVDDRWQKTEKGPFISHSIRLPNHKVGPKVTAVDLGAKRFLLYDQEQGGFVAGVLSGQIKIGPMRFGLLEMPELIGCPLFTTPSGRLWERSGSPNPVTVNYRGLYVHDQRVLFDVEVDGVEVLESAVPGTQERCLVRELEFDVHEQTLNLCVAESATAEVNEAKDAVCWVDEEGRPYSLTLRSSPGVGFEKAAAAVRLKLPACDSRTYAVLTYSEGVSDVTNAAATSSSSQPELRALRQPGARRWGERLESQGVVSEKSDQALVVDRIGVPHDNPYNALFFLAGLASLTTEMQRYRPRMAMFGSCADSITVYRRSLGSDSQQGFINRWV